MRDLARSMIRFSWTMSMLGVRQAAHLFTPPDGWQRSAEAFDAVSRAAADEMGEAAKGLYQAGDRLQSGMIDTASRLFSGTWSDPGKAMNESWKAVDHAWAGMKTGEPTD